MLLANVDGRVRRGLITSAFEGALSEKDLRALKAHRLAGGKAAGKLSLKAAPASVMTFLRKFKRTSVGLNALLSRSLGSHAHPAELQAAMEVLEHAERTLAEARTRLSEALASAKPAAASVKEAVTAHLQVVANDSIEAEATVAPATA